MRGTGTPGNGTQMGSPSPSVVRRQINQSPALPDQEPVKYRNDPTAPFRPGFYKQPPLEDTPVNPFPLSPRSARKMPTHPPSGSKKMRRKMREAQRMDEGGDLSDSDVDDL